MQCPQHGPAKIHQTHTVNNSGYKDMTAKENRIIEMIKEAYINVLGVEKWNGLTDKEKHDVIMTIAKDFNELLEKYK